MKDDWDEADNALRKTFTFRDFKGALAFVNKVGEIAERLQHHPDICMRDYNKVSISTTTHDDGNTITAKDRELIELVDSIGIS